MIDRYRPLACLFLALALSLSLAPLARAGAAVNASYGPQTPPPDGQAHCTHKNVQTMAEFEACHHPEKYQRMQKAMGINTVYLLSLGALLAVSLLYFSSLGMMPVLKAWLIYGLGGLLAAWLLSQYLGAAITGLGAMVLYFNARSGTLE